METKARIVNITSKGSECILAFSVPFTDDLRAFYDKAKDYKAIRLKAVKWAEKRSLDANSYFHVLNDKIAKVLKVSRFESKNMLIARYGQPELMDGQTITYTTKAPPEYMSQQEFLHTSLIKTVEKESSTWYVYRLYRGSHTYDSIEMAHLIDGTVSEAKELGIETLAPNEIKKMELEWQSIRKA